MMVKFINVSLRGIKAGRLGRQSGLRSHFCVGVNERIGLVYLFNEDHLRLTLIILIASICCFSYCPSEE